MFELVLWQNTYTHKKLHKAKGEHKNATKTSITQRLRTDFRTVSWSSDSHPTSVVNTVYGIPIFLLTTMTM